MAKVESILCVYDFLFDDIISDISEFDIEENLITDDINFAFLRICNILYPKYKV